MENVKSRWNCQPQDERLEFEGGDNATIFEITNTNFAGNIGHSQFEIVRRLIHHGTTRSTKFVNLGKSDEIRRKCSSSPTTEKSIRLRE